MTEIDILKEFVHTNFESIALFVWITAVVGIVLLLPRELLHTITKLLLPQLTKAFSHLFYSEINVNEDRAHLYKQIAILEKK